MTKSRSTAPYTPTPDAVALATRALQSFADVVENPPETITFGVIDFPLSAMASAAPIEVYP